MVTGQGSTLIIAVHLLGDRWYGEGDWPPSPFRLFQALVAGAYSGRWRFEGDRSELDRTFEWLESLAPPLVLAPRKKAGATVQYFVPNNDLDSVGDDPRRSSEIRTPKLLRSVLLETDDPFVYLWDLDGIEGPPAALASLCERLHTFGRGLDAAYATVAVESTETIRELIVAYRGSVSKPSKTSSSSRGTLLPCPQPGSLASLHERFELTRHRFLRIGKGAKAKIEFRQPPKPIARTVAYDRSSRYLTFEFRELLDSEAFYPIRLAAAVTAAKSVRDLAAERLRSAYDPNVVDSFVTGRGVGVVDPLRRVRFVPLPSVGNKHTEPSIRRISIELPPDCPVEADDMRWAISGQQVPKLGRVRLIEAVKNPMAYPYRIGRPARRWHTVTPMALPTQRIVGRNGALARLDTERAAVFDVVQAIRHAGLRARPIDVSVQREPFSIRGLRAEEFQADRFDARRLYHVDITFDQDVSGLLSIGDGRWLGLGLMRAVDVDVADAAALVDLVPGSVSAVTEEDDGESDDNGDEDGG